MQKDLIFRRLAEAGLCDRHVQILYCLGWQKCLKEVIGIHEKSIVSLNQYYADCANWEHKRYRWLYNLSLTILGERPTLWSLLRERGEQRVRLIELFRISLNEGLLRMLQEVERDLAAACHITKEEAAVLSIWKQKRVTVVEEAQELGVTISKVDRMRRQALDKVRQNLGDNYLIRVTMTALPPHCGDETYDWEGEYWQ